MGYDLDRDALYKVFPTKHLDDINKIYWEPTVFISFALYLPARPLSTGETPLNISNLEGSLLGALKLIMLIGTYFDTAMFVF
jgi:hypothetical protein